MSTTSTVDVLHVHPPFVPRGSALAAAAYTRLASFFRQLPHHRSRGEEAAEVREMAYQVQNTDPGFAADLFAAAARHESLDD
ncbi:MAG: hypothetical protein U1F50_02320 [Rubrivivax sp.]